MSQQQPLLDVDPYARRDEDFYATPAWMLSALLRRIYLARWVIVEPCAGDGAIVRQLTRFDSELQIVTNDIVQRGLLMPHFQLDARRKETWRSMEKLHGRIDLTLTNPPFDETFEIARQAVRFSQQGVILLQRCTWIEPTDDRGPWLAKHPPSAQIVLPRWNFRSRDGKGGSDSAPPSWFIWNKQVQLCQPGIHVVTKQERDELIAQERLSARVGA